MRISLDATNAFKVWIKSLTVPAVGHTASQHSLIVPAATAIDVFVTAHPKHKARRNELQKDFAAERFSLNAHHWKIISRTASAGFGLVPKSGGSHAGSDTGFNFAPYGNGRIGRQRAQVRQSSDLDCQSVWEGFAE